jgi:ATP-dependent RNA helicase DDX27
VINFELPREFHQYIHRVGRTARAGNEGRSISLFASSHEKILVKKVHDTSADQVRMKKTMVTT